MIDEEETDKTGGTMDSLKTKLCRIEEIRSEKSTYNDILSLFEKIFIERDKVQQTLPPPKDSLDQDGITLRIQEGFPLLEQQHIHEACKTAETYFFRLLEVVSFSNPDAVGKIREVMEEKEFTFEKIVNTMMTSEAETFFQALEERTLLLFLIKESLRPVLHVYREGLKGNVDLTTWSEGACPICGSFPSFSELRGEEGKRYLFCLDCGMEWEFERIKCPFCNNQDQKKMGYFSSDTDRFYRVMLCSSCKRYIKAADYREALKGVVPEVDHLATLHLDLIAKKEGYRTEDVLVALLAPA